MDITDDFQGAFTVKGIKSVAIFNAKCPIGKHYFTMFIDTPSIALSIYQNISIIAHINIPVPIRNKIHLENLRALNIGKPRILPHSFGFDPMGAVVHSGQVMSIRFKMSDWIDIHVRTSMD
jgi:hypothetical protein